MIEIPGWSMDWLTPEDIEHIKVTGTQGRILTEVSEFIQSGEAASWYVLGADTLSMWGVPRLDMKYPELNRSICEYLQQNGDPCQKTVFRWLDLSPYRLFLFVRELRGYAADNLLELLPRMARGNGNGGYTLEMAIHRRFLNMLKEWRET